MLHTEAAPTAAPTLPPELQSPRAKLVYLYLTTNGHATVSEITEQKSFYDERRGGDTSVPVFREVFVAETTEEAGPPSDAVSRVIQDALRSDGRLSYDALLRRLGSPRVVQTEPVANQYVRGQTDTLRTLVYTGLEALVYDVTDDSKSFLVRLSVSSTQYTSPEGVRVGLSEERVLDQIGPPTRRNASRGEWIYQESDTTPTSMVVRIRDDRVVQIDWEFYFT